MIQAVQPLHICIFTQSHVSRAPRVVKEANVYAEAGYKVTVFSTWYDVDLLDSDKSLLHPDVVYKSGIDLLEWDSTYSKIVRFKRAVGRKLVKIFGIQSTASLGYGFNSYLRQLQKEKADRYIGHQEMGMALAKKLILRGKKVAFDFEDWHSKDLLPIDRAYRPLKLLEHLECFLLEKALYTYTTSETMSKAMSTYYKAESPWVIYNSFGASDREFIDGRSIDIEDHSLPSVFWFSQVIGRGRGLELLLEALSFVKTPFQLHLRGHIAEPYAKLLKLMTPKHIQLYIHTMVPPEELISRIAEHDLGIAFEETMPESRNYTITNKVFHYLQSGIAILATETQGQKEIAKIAPDAICIVEREAKSIALKLDEILSNNVILDKMKKSSWEAGSKHFDFENERYKLLGFIKTHKE